MPTLSHDVDLIDRALQTVEQAMARCVLHIDPAPAPMAGLPEPLRERPEQTAVHFCLHSAGALLDVARTLLSRPLDHAPTPAERLREWDALVGHAKMAGRGAYRAALVLADTTSDGLSSPLTGTVPRGPVPVSRAQAPAASNA